MLLYTGGLLSFLRLDDIPLYVSHFLYAFIH